MGFPSPDREFAAGFFTAQFVSFRFSADSGQLALLRSFDFDFFTARHFTCSGQPEFAEGRPQKRDFERRLNLAVQRPNWEAADSTFGVAMLGAPGTFDTSPDTSTLVPVAVRTPLLVCVVHSTFAPPP
jgi:hypothetical protein